MLREQLTLETLLKDKLQQVSTDLLKLRHLGDQLIAKRRNEKFKRIKCSTLAKLIV